MVREWSADYGMLYGSVGLARVHSRQRLTVWRWDGDIEDAVLIVSELTTNAVSHGRVADLPMRLRLALLEDECLVIDVSDPVPAFPRFDEVIKAGPEDERGRGLHLMRQFGGEVTWFLQESGGKTVRALLQPREAQPFAAQ
ncbi:ATP-binding protein [Streptomyces sp. PSKA54]|uniref:ATP-binding protein n=1 Tax=Streptomyces himalayensis subsp. aureolus TaxID=2758039 RepID=A0A7W2HKI8_9ACTN|nr:ATP-binding protein [Streptomyces himalayensis subsp. aureolus]